MISPTRTFVPRFSLLLPDNTGIADEHKVGFGAGWRQAMRQVDSLLEPLTPPSKVVKLRNALADLLELYKDSKEIHHPAWVEAIDALGSIAEYIE